MVDFQYPTLPFHPYQFFMYQSPTINHYMDQESSIGTSNGEYGTPSNFVSKSQTPPFFTQVELKNIEVHRIYKNISMCYKQVCQRNKSGSSKIDIMRDAHAIYLQDIKTSFKL
ncbi:hypothetical protein GmHk_19G054751 [Glycine max]|nr:hypothetical protein GmHk_19G054751 [Glycine max]